MGISNVLDSCAAFSAWSKMRVSQDDQFDMEGFARLQHLLKMLLFSGINQNRTGTVFQNVAIYVAAFDSVYFTHSRFLRSKSFPEL